MEQPKAGLNFDEKFKSLSVEDQGRVRNITLRLSDLYNKKKELLIKYEKKHDELSSDPENKKLLDYDGTDPEILEKKEKVHDIFDKLLNDHFDKLDPITIEIRKLEDELGKIGGGVGGLAMFSSMMRKIIEERGGFAEALATLKPKEHLN
jgi:hypothetical protein